MDENGLVALLKARLSKWTYDIVGEDLVPYDTNYKRFDSVNLNWVVSPPERITRIDSGAVEVLIPQADYVVNLASGYVTLDSAVTNSDVIRVDYSFSPFSDADLLSIVGSGRRQVQVLIFRSIDPNNIGETYQEAIIKKCYTIALREMQFPTVKYFAISIGGRSMDKSQQVTMIETMITSNEAELLKDINTIRYFDKTGRLT